MAWFRKNVRTENPAHQYRHDDMVVKAHDWTNALCSNGSSFFDYLCGAKEYNIAPRVLSMYYAKASPVADAIDRIAKEFASIEPQIFDFKTKEFIDTNFLDVLDNPNTSMTKYQFLFNLASTYLIFGECLLYGTGITRLQELNYIEPMYLTLYSDKLNILDRIVVNKDSYTNEFKLQESSQFSFYTAPDQIARMIRGYNPNNNYSNQRGLSRLSAVSFEIEQFLAASNHNLALLGNTIKPSIILRPSYEIPDDQKERLKANLKAFMGGTSNTGKALLLNGDIEPTILNNKIDSDFQVLRKNVETAIYRRLEIPLALVSDSAMTYNNLEVATLQLYDNAVLPLAKTLYKQLQDIIFYYGKIDPNQYMVTYNTNDIEALAARKSQIIKDKVSVNAYTMNEIRRMYGDKDLIQGGDTVYVQSTMIPAAENAEDNVYSDAQVTNGTDGQSTDTDS